MLYLASVAVLGLAGGVLGEISRSLCKLRVFTIDFLPPRCLCGPALPGDTSRFD